MGVAKYVNVSIMNVKRWVQLGPNLILKLLPIVIRLKLMEKNLYSVQLVRQCKSDSYIFNSPAIVIQGICHNGHDFLEMASKGVLNVFVTLVTDHVFHRLLSFSASGKIPGGKIFPGEVRNRTIWIVLGQCPWNRSPRKRIHSSKLKCLGISF